jgi:hypothetical protein
VNTFSVENHEVICFDNFSRPAREHPHLLSYPNFHAADRDVTDSIDDIPGRVGRHITLRFPRVTPRLS